MQNDQIEMVSIGQLLPLGHNYRKLKELIDFTKVAKGAKFSDSGVGAIGFGKTRLISCLILQFMEDVSDREFERFIGENIAAKWFCGFNICEKTPDFTTISKFRSLLGTQNIAKLFKEVKKQLQAKGHCAEIFTFVDATALVSKLSLWTERDKAITAGYEKLNNEVLPKVSSDNEVRIGAKSKNKFWTGYKKHVAVDMKSGMITKVAVTKANVSDADGAKHVLPRSGAVCADKGYIGAINEMKRRDVHPMVILKNNMKEKNKDKDRFLSSLRAPYEGVFSKQNKRVRYKGVVKNQAAEFLYAIAFNLRRLLSINSTCSA